jgi:hypothetical protein
MCCNGGGRRKTRPLQQGAALAGELGASLARSRQDDQQRSDIPRLTPVAGCLAAKRVKHRVRVQLKQPQQKVVLVGDGDPQGHDRFGREVLQVPGDQHVGATCDGRGQDVPCSRL